MLKLIWWVVIGLFRSRVSLEAEIAALRHQLAVLRRKSPKRLAFSNFNRLIFASLYRIAPNVLNALVIVKPETVIRWHRAGFRFLAMEVAISRWQAKGAARNSPIDPRHELRQSAVGCSSNPWRTPQARHRNWPDLGRQRQCKFSAGLLARTPCSCNPEKPI